MAASPVALDDAQPQDNWGPSDDLELGPRSSAEPSNGPPPVDQDLETAQYSRGSPDASVSGNNGDTFRPKQVKPNKVYVGGLPEHARREDLQSCFGKIGHIVNVELKIGYGFVEFDHRKAAEESVAKYHEGYFMGNKIRVELSHGGGRTAKYAGDPGACFRCGQMGHWARECPNSSVPAPQRRIHEPPLIDRIQRDYPPREYPPPPRDARFEYPPPPRDIRRAPSPPRDYRDYPPVAPIRGREYEDYRRGPPPPAFERDRYPPPPPLPADYRGRYPPPLPPPPPEVAYRAYGGPPVPLPVPYDRYDRRAGERYPAVGYYPPPPPGGRPRTPPRPREDFDRPPPRGDYPDYRGRPLSPRYAADYPPRMAGPEMAAPRYRRRSESPPPRSSGPYEQPYAGGNLSGNGYPAGGPSGPPRVRDYPPPRNGDPAAGAYRRP